MASIQKRCVCETKRYSFEVSDELGEEVISVLYCPSCSGGASPDSLMIEVGEGENRGIWGVKLNKAVLKDLDQDFEDSERYIVSLWKDGKVRLRELKGSVRVIGVKGETGLDHEERLSEKEKREGEKPTELPKKIQKGPEESYRPLKRR